MFTNDLRHSWLAAASCLFLLSCTASDSASCVEGQSISCVCATGEKGVQTCQSENIYGECSCIGGTSDQGAKEDDARENDSGLPADSASSKGEPDKGGPDKGGQDKGEQNPPPSGAPVFLSFGTNVTQITKDELLTFTAVLTDPDGIDDLIGGTLSDLSGNISYGSFATSGQEGAYQLELTWDKINQAKSITFVQPDKRVFKAVFFDQAGHKVTKEATITLHCDGINACDGDCVDLSSNPEHCGACGQTCAFTGTKATCLQSTCYMPTKGEKTLSCQDYCGGLSVTGESWTFACTPSCSAKWDSMITKKELIPGSAGYTGLGNYFYGTSKFVYSTDCNKVFSQKVTVDSSNYPLVNVWCCCKVTY